jgi:hypothetical protein
MLRETVTWATLAGVVSFVAGIALSESIRAAVHEVGAAISRRRAQAPAMRGVVMDVEPKWEGYWYEHGELTVLGMRVTVGLANHGGQLVRNVRVRMKHRRDGVDAAKVLPALPPDGKRATVTIDRDLGLHEDHPFVEEDTDWLDAYWFEADFEDTHGGMWLLYYNPRDEVQTVERRALK